MRGAGGVVILLWIHKLFCYIVDWSPLTFNNAFALWPFPGNLKPVTEIDIGRGFQVHAHLSFVYSGKCIHQATIHVVENVSELRKYCAKLVDKPKR